MSEEENKFFPSLTATYSEQRRVNITLSSLAASQDGKHGRISSLIVLKKAFEQVAIFCDIYVGHLKGELRVYLGPGSFSPEKKQVEGLGTVTTQITADCATERNPNWVLIGWLRSTGEESCKGELYLPYASVPESFTIFIVNMMDGPLPADCDARSQVCWIGVKHQLIHRPGPIEEAKE